MQMKCFIVVILYCIVLRCVVLCIVLCIVLYCVVLCIVLYCALYCCIMCCVVVALFCCVSKNNYNAGQKALGQFPLYPLPPFTMLLLAVAKMQIVHNSTLSGGGGGGIGVLKKRSKRIRCVGVTKDRSARS